MSHVPVVSEPPANQGSDAFLVSFDRRTTRVTLLFLAVLSVALALRLWQIDTLPPGFHYDETFEAREAWNILTEPTYRPIFPTGDNTGVPPLHVYAIAGMMAIFRAVSAPISPLVTRLTTVLVGMAGIVVLAAAAQELRRSETEPGKQTGRLSFWFPIFAASALALWRWHIHYSRLGLETLWVPLVWTLICWLLLRARRTGSWFTFAALGFAIGIAPYTYYSGWALPFVAAFMAGYLLLHDWLREPTPRRNASHLLRGLLLATGVALLVVTPLALHFLNNPAALVGRFENTVDSEGDSATFLVTFVQNATRTLGMFVPWGLTGDARPVRNIPGESALNLWFAIPFFLGLIVALGRIRRPAYALILIGLIGCGFVGYITESAPHFTRILGMVAPAALLIGVGLDWIWQLPAWRGVPWRWLAIVLLVAGGITSTYDYFVRWANLPGLDRAFFAPEYDLGKALASLPKASPTYISPRNEAIDTLYFPIDLAGHALPLLFDGNVALPFTAGTTTTPEYYAVVNERDSATGERLKRLFPDVRIVRQILDDEGTVYATIYERPAATQAQIELAHPAEVLLGDGIRLVAWQLDEASLQPGSTAELEVLWAADEQPMNNWRILVQLVQTDEAGNRTIVAEHNNRPGEGTLYTYRSWKVGRDLLDTYALEIAEDAPPGEYQLEISLYRSDDERFPVEGPLVLGEIELAQPTSGG